MIKHVVETDENPPHLIANLDYTGLNFVPVSEWIKASKIGN